MAKVSSFVATMPHARALHVFMIACCQKFIPFRYDPATKVFSAYPICQEDLDSLQERFKTEFLNNGLFKPNLN